MAGTNAFTSVKNLKPDRNLFNLSHTFKADVDFGYLYPVLCKMCYPGDTIKLSVENVIRMNPAVAPFTHEVEVDFWFFAVPFRLLDPAGSPGLFESVISGGLNGTETRDFPRLSSMVSSGTKDLTVANFGIGSLSDYLGIIPPSALFDGATPQSTPWNYLVNRVMAYPWLAYNKIYTDYFADENLEPECFVDSSGNFDAGKTWMYSNLLLLHGNWSKDYFTSALPFQQRGDAPALPLSGFGSASFDIPYNSANGNGLVSFIPPASTSDNLPPLVVKEGSGNSIVYSDSASPGTPVRIGYIGVNGEFIQDVNYALSEFNSIDMSNVGTFNVSDFRLAVQMQKFMERNARAGVRFTEFLKGHFGVSPTDSRLQRAEYLGGTKGHLVVSEVLQTSQTVSGESDLGDLAGHGLVAFEDGKVIEKFHCDEHSILMGIMLIKPKAGYFQGVPREWLYSSRYDWYFPEFAHLSEQAILGGELYVDGTTTESQFDDIFGYQGRYDELRVAHDRVAGNLRDNLDYWHLARKFSSAPQLSKEFVKIDSYADGLHRIFAVEGTAEDAVNPFIATVGFDLSMLRPLPFIPEPGLVDHF